MKATVFDIQRFSLHDGPGIRTTVFLKGCPLNCLWCHNPESKHGISELMFYKKRCIGCYDCISACPLGAHYLSEKGEHIINKDLCVVCGKCAEACTGALEMCGKEMTPEEVMAEVMKDMPFYKNSGGGLTVSGGEPLIKEDFVYALLEIAKSQGINTAIETSGYASPKTVERLAELTDLFLFDIKESDPIKHKEYTGVDNTCILENLRRLSEKGARTVLRCPVIPGYNDRQDHFEAVGRLADELSSVERVDIEPYHPLGESKAEALDREYPFWGMKSPDDETVRGWCASVSGYTSKRVIIS